jgi:hypothetical protein
VRRDVKMYRLTCPFAFDVVVTASSPASETDTLAPTGAQPQIDAGTVSHKCIHGRWEMSVSDVRTLQCFSYEPS